MKALSIALLLGCLGGPATSTASQAAAAAAGSPTQQTSQSDGAQGMPSLQVLQTSAEAHPDAVDGWWHLATAAYEADHFTVATPALKRVVGLQPRMGIAWNLLGLSEFELKNYGPARSDLERAAALGNSDDPEVEHVAAYHLGLLCIRDGAFEQATTLLEKTFAGAANGQVTYALGLAALHVPLLPSEVDPAHEAMLREVGGLVSKGDAALPDFAVYAKAHPDPAGLSGAYGAALRRAGRRSEALTAFQEETRRSPLDRAAWTAVAQLATELGDSKEASLARSRADALGGERAAWMAGQRRAFSAKEASSPLDREAWATSMQAYAAGQYAAAAKGLSAWVSQHPEDGTSWAVLGLSEFGMKDYPNALIHLERGNTLGLHGSPEQVETARYTTGLLLLRAGKFEEATELLVATAKLMPGDQRLTYALGLALLRRAELPGAGTPQAALLLSCGEIAMQLQDSRYDEAFVRFKALLPLYPQTSFLHYAYGTALIALSEFPEAAEQMRAEKVLSPRSPLPLLRLASIALREHKPAEALGPSQEAELLAPSSAEAHYLHGRALLETGDTSAAIPELEAARGLNASSPEIHFTLARAYARANMGEAAARERATFAQLNEASETQKRGAGEQIYAGPRDAGSLSGKPGGATPQ